MTEKRKNPKGNPNPSPATRFGAGNRANPNGKTSEQKKMEMDNLQLALQAKNRFLRALVAKQEEQSTDEVLEGMSGSDILRLIKDAEDRVSGTPKQSVDLSSNDGSMTPKADLSGLSDEALAELVAARDASSKD